MTVTARITQRSGTQLVVSGLQRSLGRLQDTQQRMSTGRQINRPSDSPGETVAALQLRSELARTEQYARNAEDGLGWLGTADSVLQSGLDTLRRARELTVGAQSGAIGADARRDGQRGRRPARRAAGGGEQPLREPVGVRRGVRDRHGVRGRRRLPGATRSPSIGRSPRASRCRSR